jgi:hypothetical protein
MARDVVRIESRDSTIDSVDDPTRRELREIAPMAMGTFILAGVRVYPSGKQAE